MLGFWQVFANPQYSALQKLSQFTQEEVPGLTIQATRLLFPKKEESKKNLYVATFFEVLVDVNISKLWVSWLFKFSSFTKQCSVILVVTKDAAWHLPRWRNKNITC